MFLQSLLQLRQSSGFNCFLVLLLLYSVLLLLLLLLLYSVLLHVFIVAAKKQCESDVFWEVRETVLLSMQD